MKPVLIAYATREGHTRQIVEHIAAVLRARDLTAEVRNVQDSGLHLDGYGAVVLAASIHMGQHEPEMVVFAREHRAALGAMPAAFLSVSLSEADAENPAFPAEKREQARAQVEQYLETFAQASGWRPARFCPVAGAMLYTQYGLFKRLVVKLIARSKGGPTDTSRDYVFTDWEALDRFVDALLQEAAQAA